MPCILSAHDVLPQLGKFSLLNIFKFIYTDLYSKYIIMASIWY